MTGQITMQQAMNSRSHDRNGKMKEAPEWANEKRCGTCEFWTVLPPYEQPAEGHGIKGVCYSRDHISTTETDQFSYCQNWTDVWKERGL